MNPKNDIPGASKNNPVAGVKTPRKKKVPPLTAATDAVTAGVTSGATASPPTHSDALAAAREVLRTAAGLIAQIETVLGPLVQVATPDALHHKRGVPQSREPLITLIAALIRDEPAVAPAQTADDLDAGVAYIADLRRTLSRLQSLAADVEGTTRLAMVGTWTKARVSLTVAAHLAKTDKSIGLKIAPIQQAMKRGAAVVSAENAVTAGQQRLTRSQQRLARSQQQAALAQERADVSKRAQTIAAARRPGAMGAPAPAPTPAPAQAPAPTPAPGTTPHTG